MRLYSDNGKEHGNYGEYRGYIRITQGYIGIMEKNMQTAGNIGVRV